MFVLICMFFFSFLLIRKHTGGLKGKEGRRNESINDHNAYSISVHVWNLLHFLFSEWNVNKSGTISLLSGQRDAENKACTAAKHGICCWLCNASVLCKKKKKRNKKSRKRDFMIPTNYSWTANWGLSLREHISLWGAESTSHLFIQISELARFVSKIRAWKWKDKMRLYRGLTCLLHSRTLLQRVLFRSGYGPTCLSAQQLRLRSPSAFNLKADAVEESDRVLLLVDSAELLHDLLGPGFKRTRAQSQRKFIRSHASKQFETRCHKNKPKSSVTRWKWADI